MEIRDHIASGKPALVLAQPGTVIDFAELQVSAVALVRVAAASDRCWQAVQAVARRQVFAEGIADHPRRSGSRCSEKVFAGNTISGS
jgi:long-chain acyl-CoA synthetase